MKYILIALSLMPKLAQSVECNLGCPPPPPEECTAVPLRTRDNGEEVDFGTFFVTLLHDKPNKTLDSISVCEAFVESYNVNTGDCDALPGSFREVGSCDVIEAKGPPGGLLLKLEYFANVVKGNVIFGKTTAKACDCFCGESESDSIPGISLDGDCKCYCDPKVHDCRCPAPTQKKIVSLMNKLYPAEEDVTFVAAFQVEKLDIDECNVKITTFNPTSVCPGSESEAFANERTDFPSAFPTPSPSEVPTDSPTGMFGYKASFSDCLQIKH